MNKEKLTLDTRQSANGSPFTWPVRVYYEDTDSGGVVYYANYLKFMERARTEWLRQFGFEQDLLREKENLLFAVRRLGVEYHKPALFNDLLEVGVTIERIGRASMNLSQEIRRLPGELLCAGAVRIACIDATALKPKLIPSYILRKLQGVH